MSEFNQELQLTIENFQLGFEQGHHNAKSGDSGTTVNHDNGTQEIRYRVSFSKPFSKPPIIQAGLSGLDMNGPTIRIKTEANNIDENGFNLSYIIYGDDNVWHGSSASWLAIGIR
ncbi:MAG: H-type lectin domain-containing protein [Aquisalinus sp.]|nr:H-type lectin domain-containing protein [Aquisalinus sp.]